MMRKIPLLIICGPTASGKTRLAIALSQSLPIEVVSADSRQIYRMMDIGTAKATADEQAAVPHHLIDIVNPDEAFSAADFMQRARAVIAKIHQRGKLPVVVGGTGLYLTALTQGLIDAPGENPDLRKELVLLEKMEGEGALHRRLQQVDPEMALRLKPRDHCRLIRALEVYELTGEPLSLLQRRHAFAESIYSTVSFGLTLDRQHLYRRIDERATMMFSSGLIEETQELLRRGFLPGAKAMQTIGYRESVRYLHGEIPLDVAVAQTQQETRRYAKRQFTWFRKNKSIIWVDSGEEFDNISSVAKRLYAE